MSLGAWHPAFYFLIVPLVALDAAIPAVPSEIFVVTTGALGATGQLNVLLAAAVAALGAWIGDTLVYFLFKRKFTHLLDRFRWGRAVHRGILRASRKGGRSSTYAAIIAGRFIPGGRTATMAAAGMAQVPTRQFLLCSAIGCTMWGGWMVGLGYLTGSTTNLPFWGSAVIGVGVGLVVGAIIASVIGIRHSWAKRGMRGDETGAAALLPGTGSASAPEPPHDPAHEHLSSAFDEQARRR